MPKIFGANSTADEVLDERNLVGLRIFITGVSSGIGLETARALAVRGAVVTGTVRDLARGKEAVADVVTAAEQASGAIELVEIDLASLASVRAGAAALNSERRTFDVLIANAGVMATDFGRTEDGFETQFGTNHLGHFVLINEIASLIANGGRVVVLSSNGHRGADVDLDDPNFEQVEYDRWLAYNRSKTANVLFAVEFDRRHRERGVRACAVMPGTSDTPLLRHLSQEDRDAVFDKIAADRAAAGAPPLQLKTTEQMAATPVWAAIVADGDVIGGRYLEDCAIAAIDDLPGIRDGVMSYALDPEHAAALWSRSEQLVHEHF